MKEYIIRIHDLQDIEANKNLCIYDDAWKDLVRNGNWIELECDGQVTKNIDQLYIDIRHPGVRNNDGVRVPAWTCDIKAEKNFGL